MTRPDAPAAPPRNGLGTAAAVVGGLAIPLVALPQVAVVAGIGAVVLGVLGRQRVARGEATNGRAARVGQVLGVVALLLVIALLSYGRYYLRGPEGDRYADCVTQAREELEGEELGDALDACEERLEQERRDADG